MELYTSETITDTSNTSTNNELSLSFDIANGGTETVYVDDKLLTNYEVAKARAKSILLDEGYVTQRVTFSTYHIDNLHIGDTIQLDGLLFKVINIVDKIKGAVVSMDITAERADAPIRDITIINWWDLSGVKHTIESDLDTALVSTFQSRTDVTKVEIVAIKSTCTSMKNFMTNCVNCTEFICSASTKNITDFGYTWGGCSSLTSFPLIDTSSGTSFGYTWGDCSSLTSFPLIDTSSGTDFTGAWYGCSSLTSFPLIDTSSGTYFGYTWYGCQLPTIQCVPDGECGYCVMTFDDGVEVPSGDTRYVCF